MSLETIQQKNETAHILRQTSVGLFLYKQDVATGTKHYKLAAKIKYCF